jgi:hypothetical protein
LQVEEGVCVGIIFGIRAQKGSFFSVAEKKENSPCHQGEGIDKYLTHQRIGKFREEEAGRW